MSFRRCVLHDIVGRPGTVTNDKPLGDVDDDRQLAVVIDERIVDNDFMCGLFAGIGIKLIDFKIEFGRMYDGDALRIVLADEISPDSCRLWDMATNEKLDKDRFRRDLGGVSEAYQEGPNRDGAFIPLRHLGQSACSGSRPQLPLGGLRNSACLVISSRSSTSLFKFP